MGIATFMESKTTQPTGETKFKQDLKTYFPDLYQFWSLFAFDPFYEEVLQGILKAVNENAYGKLEIVYQNGKINYVNLSTQLTAHKKQRIHYLGNLDKEDL